MGRMSDDLPGDLSLPPLPTGASGGRRLLLVEDDADLSAMLEQLLSEEGYAVTAVRDGQAGLHQGLVGEWDVLVVDRGLPGIEGVDLVTRLRSRGLVRGYRSTAICCQWSNGARARACD